MGSDVPKVVILAGGKGTRIAEESIYRPKALVEIAGRPLIWHIMKHYSDHGFQDFIVCAGYKGDKIKEYFLDYFRHSSDFTVNLASGDSMPLSSSCSGESWNVTVVDTGAETMTGGRIKRVAHLLGETFMLTYGDGVSDVNISEEYSFHKSHGKQATVVAVKPPSRFAVLDILNSGVVASFQEKPDDEVGWINGGFFILDRRVTELVVGDETIWEREPLEKLAAEGQLVAFRHQGFWHSVDSLRDKQVLESKLSRASEER